MNRTNFCCSAALGGIVLAVRGMADAAELPGPTGQIRLTPAGLAKLAPGGAIGSSNVAGIEDWTLKGTPTASGLYTIALRVPKHTRIQAHWHPDDRVATVVRGTWSLGYGEDFDESKLRTLPPGSFYTEPSRQGHFAQTHDEDVLVFITGSGPTGTTYYDANWDPARRR